MNQIYDIHFVMTALKEAGWKPTQTDEHWLLLPVEGKHGLFFVSFYCNPHDKMLSARGNIPVYIPAEKESSILEFINYGNYQVPIGNFELDVKSQQVYYRIGMFFNYLMLNTQLLHNVVHEISQAVQDFWPAIRSLVEGNMSVREAFRQNSKKNCP